MTVSCDTLHLLLQAELDGELDAAGAAGLAEHLAMCPDCTKLRADLAAFSTQLRGGLTRFDAPPALRRSIPVPRRPRAWFLNPRHAASFGAGLAVAASLMPFLVHPAPSANEFGDLVNAHIRALQPGHLLDVPSSDRHTVKPWFDGRVAFSPSVPDLATEKFPLLGGRLDSLGGRPVAALVYGRRQHVIDVFVTTGDHPRPTAMQQGYNTIGWTQGGLVYQAVSDLNATELAAFADLMQTRHRRPL